MEQEHDECLKNHHTEKVMSEETNILYVVCHTCEKTLGRACEVYSRVVGYLRPVDAWNKGKKEEYGMRKMYKI